LGRPATLRRPGAPPLCLSAIIDGLERRVAGCPQPPAPCPMDRPRRPPIALPAFDLAPAAGTWVNTERSPRAIDRLVLETRDGELRARAVGAGGGAWEGATPELYADGPGSSVAGGLIWRGEAGGVDVHLQVQLKLGVAVAGGFYRRAGRRVFVREFFYRQGPPAPAGGGGGVPAVAALAASGRVDPAPIAGRWRNAEPATAFLETIVIAPAAQGVRIDLRPAGRGSAAATTAAGETFPCVEEDGVASVCARARHRLGRRRCELQLRLNKGILAVTTFHRFPDRDPRHAYVTRELFHR